MANSPRFRDMSPKQIVPNLADQGIYIGSESSFYRVLKEQEMINHRQRIKAGHPSGRPMSTWPAGLARCGAGISLTCAHRCGACSFYLYMFVDVWSRKIVAATVFEEESMDLSARLFTKACFTQASDPEGLVLHSDNGGPMKGSTMLATLQKLGVVPSFSRPRVSDDNPYSERLFRTMKYRPEYPLSHLKALHDAQALGG